MFIFFNILALLTIASICFALVDAPEPSITCIVIVVLMFVGFIGWSFGTTTHISYCEGAKTTLKSRNWP